MTSCAAGGQPLHGPPRQRGWELLEGFEENAAGWVVHDVRLQGFVHAFQGDTRRDEAGAAGRGAAVQCSRRNNGVTLPAGRGNSHSRVLSRTGSTGTGREVHMESACLGERQTVTVVVQPGDLEIQHAGKDVVVQLVRRRQCCRGSIFCRRWRKLPVACAR